MAEWQVTIMSEDPYLYDEDGFSEDPHQKYGLSVDAENESDAIEKGTAKFEEESPELPIHWVKAYKL